MLFAHRRTQVALKLTGMNMVQMGGLDGIGAPAGLVCFAGVGEKDTTGLRESTLCSLNPKT